MRVGNLKNDIPVCVPQTHTCLHTYVYNAWLEAVCCTGKEEEKEGEKKGRGEDDDEE